MIAPAAPRGEPRSPPSVAAPPAPPGSPPVPRVYFGKLAPERAHLFAWALLAAVNAAFIVRIPVAVARFGVRALHHTYDAAQLLAVGFAASATIAVSRRLAPKRPAVGLLALAIFSAAVGTQTLDEDLSHVAMRLARGGPEEPWLYGLILAVSLGIPGAAILGRLLRRRILRWFGVAAGIGAAIVNELILLSTYAGAHLYLAAGAATLIGSALTGAAFPEAPRRRLPLAFGRAVLCVVSAWSIVVWPMQSVVIELFKVEGAVVMPLLARWRAQREEGALVIPPEAHEWFTDRSTRASIPPSSPPLLANGIVLFITIDAFRADVLRRSENLGQLPRLRRLIDEGVFFSDVRTPGASTLNTIASIFTDKYRSQLSYGWQPGKGYTPSDDPSPRFTEIIAAARIPTFTVVSYPNLESSYGIARGFTEEVIAKPEGAQPYPLSDAMVTRALTRIADGGGGPLFIFMHFMDPHDPYDAAGTEGTDYERYVREIGLCDRSIGRLWDELERRRLLGRTALIISADHGEGLGQHNTPFHGGSLYEELVRVPLILRAPGAPPRRIDAPVSLMDVAPTVLDLFGLPTPGSFMGQSLTPYLRGQSPALERPISGDTGRIRSMVLGSYKLIEDDSRGTEEIYDLSRDPGELDNLFDTLGDEGQRRMAVLHTFFQIHRLNAGKASRRSAD